VRRLPRAPPLVDLHPRSARLRPQGRLRSAVLRPRLARLRQEVRRRLERTSCAGMMQRSLRTSVAVLRRRRMVRLRLPREIRRRRLALRLHNNPAFRRRIKALVRGPVVLRRVGLLPSVAPPQDSPVGSEVLQAVLPLAAGLVRLRPAVVRSPVCRCINSPARWLLQARATKRG
jgi:hypothetical protein